MYVQRGNTASETYLDCWRKECGGKEHLAETFIIILFSMINVREAEGRPALSSWMGGYLGCYDGWASKPTLCGFDCQGRSLKRDDDRINIRTQSFVAHPANHNWYSIPGGLWAALGRPHFRIALLSAGRQDSRLLEGCIICISCISCISCIVRELRLEEWQRI